MAEVAKHLGLNAGNIYNWRTNRAEERGPTLPTYTLTKEDRAWLDAMQLMSSNGSNGSHIEEEVQEEDSDVADVVVTEDEQVAPQINTTVLRTTDEERYVAELLDRVNELAAERDAALAATDAALRAAEDQTRRADEFAKVNEKLTQQVEDAKRRTKDAEIRMVLWRSAAKDALNDES